MPSLLIGCGNSREKKVYVEGNQGWTGDLVTIDMNPDCGADLVWDLETRPLPFNDETFDELAAYDVLEHIGRQGDWRGWFDEMGEYHRILKPGGLFGIIVPIWEDALADPGHTRFFQKNYFGFLNQKFYEENLKKGAQVTDYRWYNKRWWDITFLKEESNHLCVLLKK